ncbi:hypothetical protein BS78_06G255900 [Paspalum vaginatum]|nr:hypothetical protein BS78_06G255900 [Paspalum vaginatum]
MRACAVAFAALLLLLLLATRAHGIRLDRQFHEAISSSKETGGPKSGAAGEASIAESATKHCTPDGHCSGKKVKRALAHAETVGAKPQLQSSNWSTGNNDRSTTTTVDAEAAQRGRHEAEATSGHASQSQSHQDDDASARQRDRQTYPDIMDIAGMDYSPATRKPPIHN